MSCRRLWERMPDQAGLTNPGRLVIRLTAQKDSVSAAESEQQASTGDPANMRENTQENTQQEVGLADASYFGDNRFTEEKSDSQDHGTADRRRKRVRYGADRG